MTQLDAQKIQLAVFNLAHQNGMTVDTFLSHITQQYEVDNSHLPRNDENEIVYENGDLGIDLDMPDDDLLSIHWAAARKGMTTNEFVVSALEAKIAELKQENKI